MSICGSCPAVEPEVCKQGRGSDACISHLQEVILTLIPVKQEEFPLEETLKKYPELKDFQHLYPFGRIGRKQVSNEAYEAALSSIILPQVVTDWQVNSFFLSRGILIYTVRGKVESLKPYDQTIILRRPPDGE